MKVKSDYIIYVEMSSNQIMPYILLQCTDYPNSLFILQIHGVSCPAQTMTYVAISCANCYSGTVLQEVHV